MKKIAIILTLVMVFGLVACASDDPVTTPDTSEPPPETGGVETDPRVTLTYAEVNPLDSLMGRTAQEFKRQVELLSGGSITINIQASGVLGSEHDVLDSMLGGVGTVDLSRISAFALTPYGAERSVLLTVPFTFEGRDHFWRYADSPLAQEVLMEPHNIGLGIRGICYLEEGFRHFFTRNPIAGMADLSGLKLRVSTDPIMVGMVEGLGAIATVLAFTELYSGLSTGVVDGAEQPIVNYLANSFHEVAPYMILNGHTLGAAQIVMTDDAWDRLTERQQDVIMEAARLASNYNRNASEDAENEAVEALLADGVTFIEVVNTQEWRDAVAATIEYAIAGQEADYQAILAMAR